MSQASMITLRHLNIFVALYENKGNMTRTAEKCYIAQPAISLALSELEDLYKCRLFDRISRKLYVNDAGTRLYGFARKILNQIEELDRGMKDVCAGSSLRVGSCDSMDMRRLPRYVSEFMKENPDVRVRSAAEATESLIGKVLGNELDLAFVDRNPGSKRLVAEKFLCSKLVLAASPSLGFADGQKVSAKELAALPLLLREKGSGMRQAFDQAMEKKGFTAEPVYEGAGNGCVADAALAGMGIALLPAGMVGDHRRRGELVLLEAEEMDLEITYYVIYHKDKDLSENAKGFLAMCRAYEEEKVAMDARRQEDAAADAAKNAEGGLAAGSMADAGKAARGARSVSVKKRREEAAGSEETDKEIPAGASVIIRDVFRGADGLPVQSKADPGNLNTAFTDLWAHAGAASA